jgi:hypothetical protein
MTFDLNQILLPHAQPEGSKQMVSALAVDAQGVWGYSTFSGVRLALGCSPGASGEMQGALMVLAQGPMGLMSSVDRTQYWRSSTENGWLWKCPF